MLQDRVEEEEVDSPQPVSEFHDDDVMQAEPSSSAPPPARKKRVESQRSQPTLTNFFISSSNTGSVASTSKQPSASTSSTQIIGGNQIIEQSVSESVEASQEDLDKINSSRGLIWNYFSKINRESSKCKACGSVKQTPTGTTIVMIRHLEKDHPISYTEFTRLQILKKKINVKKNKTSKNDESFSSKNILFPLDPKGPRATAITKGIAVFICKGLQPYSVVEESGFQYLMSVVEPKYAIPHRTTFSRRIIPDLYNELKKEMELKLLCVKDSLESVCITTDIWTSRAQDAFIGFTIQFVDSSFKLDNFTVECQPFPGQHFAAEICARMQTVIQELNLDSDHIVKYVVSDNGANMLAALEQPSEERQMDIEIADILRKIKSWEHKKCVNHTTQLAISDAKKAMGLNTIIHKVSNLVSRYSRSRNAQESLEHFQREHKLPQHCLIQRVPTRWDTDFAMLERAVEQKAAITSELCLANEENLNSNEWKLAEGFVEVLRPVANHTAEMGSVNMPTGSMVLPVILEIESDLEEFIRKASKGSGIMFARKFLSCLRERFEPFKGNETYILAMLIDPRYKDILQDETWYLAPKDLLRMKAEEKYRSRIRRGLIESEPDSFGTSNPQPEPDNSLASPYQPSAKKSKWKHLINKTSQRNAKCDDEVTDSIKTEVESYLMLPNIDVDADPLAWWKSNQQSFPNLALVAMQYLGLAATETASERVFSTGSNTVTCKRTNLLPEHVKEVVFCHDNIKITKSGKVCFKS